jgi:DNA (cytosine-5)-methyltransferase 1
VPKIIPESQVSGRGGSILLARSRWSQNPNFEGSNIQPGTLIDLDDLENFDDLWNDEEDLQILRVEERRASQFRRKQTKFEVPQRNPSISKPLLRLQELQYKSMLLRPSKTVELADGDFLLITDIIQQGASEFTLRGNKIQRCNAMNGLLEKKLNEVCFFHEVDLDDPRVPHEQGAVEVSIHTVKKLRALRKTNQLFPACRSVALEEFRTQQDAAAEGGLTVRWKYTCTYACALDRWLNNPKERALEFLREEECTKNTAIADELRRLCWRGETIPGGAYIPELEEGKAWIEHVSKGSIINLVSSTPEPESDCTIINSPVAVSEIGGSDKGASPFTFVWPSAACRRRRSSSPIGSTVPEISCKRSKKAHFDDGDEIEIIRQDLSVLRVNDSPGWRDECFLDLPFSSSSGQNQCISSIQMENSPQSYPEQAVKNELLPTIDLSSSHLATPPPTGVISCNPVSVKKAIIRSPGQMLTYGDAFCGAGGTTRGAIMAGLRVMWGFDHWNHACSTWRVNFPQAVCYEMSSHEFVSKVQGGRSRKPLNVKVDILHLSPPCQYFSPAHTVDCPSDEMNVASLYAVGPVIQVAKPRIVTLEQTFGIVAVRFRKYFNSLIQMFTALGFSVRWAVVPLAQWVCSVCNFLSRANDGIGFATTSLSLDHYRSLVSRFSETIFKI